MSAPTPLALRAGACLSTLVERGWLAGPLQFDARIVTAARASAPIERQAVVEHALAIVRHAGGLGDDAGESEAVRVLLVKVHDEVLG